MIFFFSYPQLKLELKSSKSLNFQVYFCIMFVFLVLVITTDVDGTQAPKVSCLATLKVPTTAGATICKTSHSSFGTLGKVLLSGGLLRGFLLRQTTICLILIWGRQNPRGIFGLLTTKCYIKPIFFF